jgi:uncharacterized protein (DUF4213/DUF364 family)
MSLIETLISSMPDTRAKVDKVVIGTRWILIVSSRCGLASISGRPDAHDRSSASALLGKPLRDLFGLARSPNQLEAALGIAAVNAGLAEDLESLRFQPHGIPRAGGKTVALVGDFAFAEQLKGLAENVILVQSEDAEEMLSQVDIAIIPGSAVVDHSMEGLLRAAATCYTVVYGPSTPLSPVLFDFGADQLVGIRVENFEKTIRCIDQGMQNLMECPGLRPVVLTR